MKLRRMCLDQNVFNGHKVKTWRDERATAIGYMRQKVGDARLCGLRVTWVDAEKKERQACILIIFRTPAGGEVIRQSVDYASW